MIDRSASVIVVSIDRPNELRSCLKALIQQDHKKFEIVVVADAAGLAQIEALGLQNQVKQTLFEPSNISAARNEGLRLAAGEVAAFIDDDAIAEPTWLSRLCAPFENQIVAAAGGFVRGRNGISFQWKAEAVGLTGDAEPIEVSQTSLQQGTAYRAIKTHGTNCAFRRSVLVEEGGFDEFYRFYLDETDVNMRLALRGLTTAIVPGAEVQHGFAQSAGRQKDRTPKSLRQIGASKAYFVRKFGSPKEKLEVFRESQRKRLMRHLVRGGLEPRDIARLMNELEIGFDAGWASAQSEKVDLTGQPPVFKPFPAKPRNHIVLQSRWIGRRRTHRRARKLATAGNIVTAFIFSPTSIFHRRWFHPDGYWVQSGGKFGKSNRDDPLFKWYPRHIRVTRELKEISQTRPT